MKYKAVRHIPGSKKNVSAKSTPTYSARSYDGIRFTTIFLEHTWLKAGPKRVINICTEANENLWPVRGRISYNRELEAFVWEDMVDMHRYTIKFDGTLGKRL